MGIIHPEEIMRINFKFGTVCHLHNILRNHMSRYGPTLTTIQKNQEIAELISRIAERDLQQMGILVHLLQRSKKL